MAGFLLVFQQTQSGFLKSGHISVGLVAWCIESEQSVQDSFDLVSRLDATSHDVGKVFNLLWWK